jgi:hypothetical protein
MNPNPSHRLTYLGDDGTTITLVLPWPACSDIVPPPSIPFRTA